MKLGVYLHELWRTRVGLPICLVIAAAAALFSGYQISLAPLGLHQRSIGMAAASTHVLVDNASSILLHPQSADQVNQMTQRSALLGNIIGTAPVREFIASRVGVPAQTVQVQSPTTPQYPLAFQDRNNKRSTTDLIRTNNQYRIDVEANPTVPILGIYTEARNVATAIALANGAVAGLRDYLSSVAHGEGVGLNAQVRLLQLGGAEGGMVTGGVDLQLMAVVFLFAFMLSFAASIGLVRLRRGWRSAQEADRRNPSMGGHAAGSRNGDAGSVAAV
jgi:hypothetical protein